MTPLLGFVLGWSVGFGACWLYFVRSDLIRNREEWHAERKRKGKE